MGIKNSVAVITGATSGMGAEFARRWAKEGYDLVITGRRRDLIGELAAEITRMSNVKVEVVISELSDEADLKVLVDRVKGIANLEVLVNNAGFGIAEPFSKVDLDLADKMVKVHCMAPMRLTQAALPAMIRRGTGYIINVSSTLAIMMMPYQSVYSASKAFVKNFTEVLAMELAGTGIKVQALCPGLTRTDFQSRLGKQAQEHEKDIPKDAWMTPQEVVEASLKDLESGKVLCIPGFTNKIMCELPVVMPSSWYAGMMKKMTEHDKKK
jgi:uncharacterized protein